MNTSSAKCHRQSVRLKDYDYSQNGAYFLTICVQNKECLLGEIIDGEMRLNHFGKIISEEWENSCAIRPNVKLDEFVVMPNHIHGIVVIGNVGAHGRVPVQNVRVPVQNDPAFSNRIPRSLGSFVAGFKSVCTKRINILRRTPYNPLWQRNYYEHVIRDEADLHRIRQYIQNNPANWGRDELFK